MVFSEEHKKKLSDAHRGKSGTRKGKTCSEDMRRKIAKTLTGRKLSTEHCASLSKAKTGKTLSTKGKLWTEARRAAHNRRKENGGIR
jgi:hypothetical protein